MSTTGFRYYLRVRYGECDAQKVVFNARWGDSVDITMLEATVASLDRGAGGVVVDHAGYPATAARAALA